MTWVLGRLRSLRHGRATLLLFIQKLSAREMVHWVRVLAL